MCNTSWAFAIVHVCLEHDSNYADEVKFLSDLVGSFGVCGDVAQVGCFDTRGISCKYHLGPPRKHLLVSAF